MKLIVRFPCLAAAVLAIASCNPDLSSNGSAATKSRPPTSVEPALGASSLLEPMAEPEWRASISDGVGCSLVTPEGLLLLVIEGDGAVAKSGGTVRKLTGGESGFDWQGGLYAGEGLSITVRGDGTSSAKVTVVSGNRTEQFLAEWSCGS